MRKGKRCPISTGLPWGGASSPIIWLMYFNKAYPQLAQRSERASLPARSSLDLYFVDDVSVVVTTPEIPTLTALTHFNDPAVRETPHLDTLRIQTEETQSLLLDPRTLTDGIYRRTDAALRKPT